MKTSNPDLKFAVDFKTTYRRDNNLDFCNGFTLGSHGMNYGTITVKDPSGETRTIRNLADFVHYRGGDATKIIPKTSRRRQRS